MASASVSRLGVCALIVASVLVVAAPAQTGGATTPIPAMPFTKGVNVSSWFEVPSAGQILVNRHPLEDFLALRALGVEVIRLPVNLHPMTSGAPDFAIDPLLLEFLDVAVDRAEKAGLYVIIDNHTFDPAVPTKRDVEKALHKVWSQLATRYRGRSDRVIYEILNEPHGISPSVWAAIQGRVIETIRAIDDRHWIIVGGANFNSYAELGGLPRYAHDKLLYTFHFYDPFIFTHQGASWTDPPLTTLAGIPFPPGSGPLPAVPKDLKGTWVSGSVSNYASEGSPERVRKAIDVAYDFARKRNVPVFCGEFGVYLPNSSQPDRARWYDLVRAHLESRGISWALWDCFGSFGMFTPGAGNSFASDLDVGVTAALGLSAPAQTARRRVALSEDFVLYDDYPAGGVRYNGHVGPGGTADLYDRNALKGSFAIRLANLERYNHVGFRFSSPLDLSALVRGGYELRFYARTTAKNARFDVRFLNPDDLPADLPWRMSATVEPAALPPDGKWHLVRIPLSEMFVTGAWKGEWYPDTKRSFDWTRVARFEIATEHHSFEGMEFSFDQIELAR